MLKNISHNLPAYVGIVGVITMIIAIVCMAFSNKPFLNVSIFIIGVVILMCAGFIKEARGELF